MENGIREKIERWKIKAEVFLKNNTRAFIVDIQDTYYFCNIIFVGEDTLYVYNFKGKNAGAKTKLFWSDIDKFEEYKELGVVDDLGNKK